MALDIVPKFEVKSKIKFLVSDLTGFYNANNPTAWWENILIPKTQPSITDIEAANLIWIFPDGSVAPAVDLLAGLYSLYDVPGNAFANPRTIIPQDIGYAAGVSFSDGKNIVTLQVSGMYTLTSPAGEIESEFISAPTEVVYIIEGVKCCVANMHRRIDEDNLTIEDDLFVAAFEADGILVDLEWAIECTDWTRADILLAKLQAICVKQGACCN